MRRSSDTTSSPTFPIPANATDVTSEVGTLIKSKPDVLLHASYITDAILFTKTFKEMGFCSAGHTDDGRIYRTRLSPGGKGGRQLYNRPLDICPGPCQEKTPGRQGQRALQEEIRDRNERKRCPQLCRPRSSWRMPSTGQRSTNPEAIVRALQATNIPGKQMIYPWKGIKFDPKTNQNIYAQGTLGPGSEPAIRDDLALRLGRQPMSSGRSLDGRKENKINSRRTGAADLQRRPLRPYAEEGSESCLSNWPSSLSTVY